MDTCRECSGRIVQTPFEYACSECGLVADMFVTVENLCTATAPPVPPPATTTTFKAPGLFSILFPDARAEERPRRKKDEARVLRDASVRDSLEFGNVVMAFLKLSDCVQDDARNMFRTITERGIYKAERRRIMIVSCIYHACQAYGCPRTVKELRQASGVRLRSLLKENAFVAERCKLSKTKHPSTVESVISRLLNEMDLGSLDRRVLAARARSLFREAGKDALQGRGTNTVAALYIYRALAAANANVSASAVARISGVSAVTLKALL